MKRWEVAVGLIVVMVALVFLPKEVWMHQRRERFHALEKQIPGCHSLPCLTQLEADMHSLNDEIDHRPWYVWGDLSMK